MNSEKDENFSQSREDRQEKPARLAETVYELLQPAIQGAQQEVLRFMNKEMISWKHR